MARAARKRCSTKDDARGDDDSVVDSVTAVPMGEILGDERRRERLRDRLLRLGGDGGGGGGDCLNKEMSSYCRLFGVGGCDRDILLGKRGLTETGSCPPGSSLVKS